MFIGLDNCLRLYDFLSSYISKDEARAIINYHVWRDEIVILEDAGKIVGAAFFVQINDPNDVNGSMPPNVKEDVFGRYVYFPFLVINKAYRGKTTLVKGLFQQALNRCPQATRLAFRRWREFEKTKRKKKFGNRHPERVHVIHLRDDDVERNTGDSTDSGSPIGQ